ncbi:MAG: hypothetical protein KAR06_10850 [Deltaproteobacteria bacterium]|nr:hypothetical protein [Deltaproteobacteria bacterium]
MALINTHEAAARLARTIVSDIVLYNKDKIKAGIENDNLFDVLEEPLHEGEKLYKTRVEPDLMGTTNYYNKAIVDILVKRSGNIESEIW